MLNQWLSVLYELLIITFDSTLFLSRSKSQQDLLILRLDSIGDFILWLDTAKHYRTIFPNKNIILLANKAWTELAEKLPYWDEVWSLDRHRFVREPTYRFRLLRKVRKAGFNIVVHPTYSREFLCGDSVVRICGAQDRIGSVGDSSNTKLLPMKHISNRWYTQLIPVSPHLLMELLRNAEFIRYLGMKNFFAGIAHLDAAIEEAGNLSQPQQSYYILFPGASRSGKRWPLKNFSELAEKIYQSTGWRGIVCGSLAETALCKTLQSMCYAPLRNLAGEVSLLGLSALIRDANFLISNDTSAIHIAPAVGTPSVCVLGGGHYGRFMPYEVERKVDRPLPIPVTRKMDCYGCNWKCIYKIENGEAVPCIRNIAVHDVFGVVESLLNS